MSWYVSDKDLLKSVWNVRSIYDKLHFNDILLTWNNAYQQTLQKNYYQEKKFKQEVCDELSVCVMNLLL